MGVVIDRNKCIGCRQCIDVCPGNIIRINDSGKAYLKKKDDCWSCVSCVKECPVSAIELKLSPEIGGRGGRMSLKTKGNVTEWTVIRGNGEKKVIITNTAEANAY